MVKVPPLKWISPVLRISRKTRLRCTLSVQKQMGDLRDVALAKDVVAQTDCLFPRRCLRQKLNFCR